MIKLAVGHIGFKRVAPAIDEAFRSAINGGNRRRHRLRGQSDLAGGVGTGARRIVDQRQSLRLIMNLNEVYKMIGQSIVAVAVKSPSAVPSPSMPTIVGTGFFVADGLVATNDHVIQIVEQLSAQARQAAQESPVRVVLFYLVPTHGMCQISVEVLGTFTVDVFTPGKAYYGPAQPDLGFLHVALTGAPFLEPAAKTLELEPGMRVATAGFPMGTKALRAPGYIHQLTPTLQDGIISAVLPFPCSTPHAIMVNIMAQGGASGSPVFLCDCPKVVGILYAGLQESFSVPITGGSFTYPVPTNFSYCVAGHYLHAALASIRSQRELAFPADTPRLDDLLKAVRERGDWGGAK